jgi:hypothetical protein
VSKPQRKYFMEKSKKLETLGNIIGQICTVLSILFVILYTVVSLLLPEIPNLFNKESLSKELNHVIIVVVFSGTMLFVFPCIVFINSKKNRDKLIKELNEITDKLNISKDRVEEIKGLSIPPLIKNARLIKNKDEFFKALKTARENVLEHGHTEIRLMNFAKTIQEQRKEQSAAETYYQGEMEFYSGKKNVHLFKIVSIHTKEKFKECLELVKQAEQNKLENFHLAYLHIEKFGDVTPPKIIGMQIIADTVIFMNPISARIDVIEHQDSTLVECKEIAEKYSAYHKKVWEGITNYHKKWLSNKLTDEEKKEYKEFKGYSGHILYTGDDGITSENRVWENINNDLPEHKQLKPDELAKELAVLQGLVLPKMTRGHLGTLFDSIKAKKKGESAFPGINPETPS